MEANTADPESWDGGRSEREASMKMYVEGMMCEKSCAKVVRETMVKFPFVNRADVNISDGTVMVHGSYGHIIERQADVVGELITSLELCGFHSGILRTEVTIAFDTELIDATRKRPKFVQKMVTDALDKQEGKYTTHVSSPIIEESITRMDLIVLSTTKECKLTPEDIRGVVEEAYRAHEAQLNPEQCTPVKVYLKTAQVTSSREMTGEKRKLGGNSTSSMGDTSRDNRPVMVRPPLAIGDDRNSFDDVMRRDGEELSSDVEIVELFVEDMMCVTTCARIIKLALESVKGVQFVQIAVERKRATVMGLQLDVEELIQVVQAAGFSASEIQSSTMKVKLVNGKVHPNMINGRCLYKTGKCNNPRAKKKDGTLHNYCQWHRQRQNTYQKKNDSKHLLMKQAPLLVASDSPGVHNENKSEGGMPPNTLKQPSPTMPSNAVQLGAKSQNLCDGVNSDGIQNRLSPQLPFHSHQQPGGDPTFKDVSLASVPNISHSMPTPPPGSMRNIPNPLLTSMDPVPMKSSHVLFPRQNMPGVPSQISAVNFEGPNMGGQPAAQSPSNTNSPAEARIISSLRFTIQVLQQQVSMLQKTIGQKDKLIADMLARFQGLDGSQPSCTIDALGVANLSEQQNHSKKSLPPCHAVCRPVLPQGQKKLVPIHRTKTSTHSFRSES